MWWSHSVEYFRSLDTVKVVAGFTERITNKRVYFCFLKFRNKSLYSIVKDRWPWTLLGHKGMFGCKHCILSWKVAYWVCDSWPLIELVILAWLSVHNTLECFCLVVTADVCYVGVLLSLTLFQAEGFHQEILCTKWKEDLLDDCFWTVPVAVCFLRLCETWVL